MRPLLLAVWCGRTEEDLIIGRRGGYACRSHQLAELPEEEGSHRDMVLFVCWVSERQNTKEEERKEGRKKERKKERKEKAEMQVR